MDGPPTQGQGPSTRQRRGGSSRNDAGRDAAARLQSIYQNTVKRRALRKPAPHALEPETAAKALAASVKGFIKASKNPYVIDKFIKSAAPILVTVLVVYLLGRLLLMPIQAVAFLVGVLVPGATQEGATKLGHTALTDLVYSTALLLMLLLRSWLHKPIFKCFIHTLRDINPQLAQQIESTKPLPKARKPPQQQQEQTKPLGYKIGRLLVLQLATTLGRRTPIIGYFVAPVMLFGSGERLLGTERALLLAALGLLPPVAPWALRFLHLWRASHVTGSELLGDYTRHAIPGEGRDEWFRSNEVAVFAYMFPQLLLMDLPILGPLLFLPASAAAAYLADFLHRLPGNARFTIGPATSAAQAGQQLPPEAAQQLGGAPPTRLAAPLPPAGLPAKTL